MASFIGNILQRGLQAQPTTQTTAMTSPSRSVVDRVTGFLKQPGWAPPTVAAGVVIAFLVWRAGRSRGRRRRR